VRITCLPPDHSLATLVQKAAEAAVRTIQLEQHLAGLTLCLDDITADERVWLLFSPPAAVPGSGQKEGLRALTLYVHPDQLLKDEPLPANLAPGVAAWEMRPPGRPRPEAGQQQPSRPKIERFLHHQLLLVRDLCDGSLIPDAIPRDWVGAFQEAWAVTIDGRLRRAYLPGYSAAERRRRFSRFFAIGGVILPDHWRIFHVLWDDEDIDQGRVLRLLERLPRRNLARN
jgi:hypothetical protein